MIAMEVKLNGKKVAVAGADQGRILLSDITIRNDPDRPHRFTEASLDVSGGNGDGVLNIFLETIKLKIGDKVTIKLIQTDTADTPVSKYVKDE